MTRANNMILQGPMRPAPMLHGLVLQGLVLQGLVLHGLVLAFLLTAGCAITDGSGDSPAAPRGDGAATGDGPTATTDHVPTPLFDEIPDTRLFPAGPQNRDAESGNSGTTHAVARVTHHGPSQGQTTPAVEIRTAAGGGRGGDLDTRVDAVLESLLLFADRPESELADGERLKKYRLQRELIAMHYLLPAGSESRYLDPLLESLENPTGPPSAGHLLMVAAFYHDIDLEKLRNETMARLDLPSATEAAPRLQFKKFSLCKEVRGLRDYSPIGKRVLDRGDWITLYGELTHLKNVREDEQYVSGIEVIATLEDDRGTALHRQELSGRGGDRLIGTEPTPENFFQYPYQIPRDVDSGQVRLVLEVRDLYSGAEAREETSFRLRR